MLLHALCVFMLARQRCIDIHPAVIVKAVLLLLVLIALWRKTVNVKVQL